MTIALTTHTLLLLGAVLCFGLAALPGIKTGINLQNLGLVLFAGSFLA